MTGDPVRQITRAQVARQSKELLAQRDRIVGMIGDRLPRLLALLVAIDDMWGGQPGAAATEQTRTSGHTTVTDDTGITMPAVSDPTGEAAITPNLGRHALKATKRALQNIEAGLLELARIDQELHPNPTQAAPELNTVWCRSCARTKTDGGEKRRVRPVATGTVAGRLAEPMPLCRWCWDQVKVLDGLPPRDDVDAHHRGIRIRRRAS